MPHEQFCLSFLHCFLKITVIRTEVRIDELPIFFVRFNGSGKCATNSTGYQRIFSSSKLRCCNGLYHISRICAIRVLARPIRCSAVLSAVMVMEMTATIPEVAACSQLFSGSPSGSLFSSSHLHLWIFTVVTARGGQAGGSKETAGWLGRARVRWVGVELSVVLLLLQISGLPLIISNKRPETSWLLGVGGRGHRAAVATPTSFASTLDCAIMTSRVLMV